LYNIVESQKFFTRESGYMTGVLICMMSRLRQLGVLTMVVIMAEPISSNQALRGNP
jgi:hypothetical protein